MTEPTVDTRRFTPAQIAIAVAKRIARVGDFDENWSRAIAERGIELADDGGFTITTEGGQTFHLAVTETTAANRAADVRRGVEQIADALHTTPADVVEQLREATATAAGPTVYFPGDIVPAHTDVQAEGGTIMSWKQDYAVEWFWGAMVARPFPRGVDNWRAVVATAKQVRDLRMHLASVHKLANAFDLPAADLDDIHQHDHVGPCGIRNHDVADRSYDEATARAVIAETQDGAR